jgi:predicted nucleotidyltransferase
VRSASLGEYVRQLLDDLVAAATAHYGNRLVSVVVFGSMGRGTPRADSDLDVLIVADDLPRGRMARVEDFAAVEARLHERLGVGQRAGFSTECSPVFKTREEVLAGSPLFLDMVEDARILYDRDGFVAATLARLRERLVRLGARRVWRGNAWFWDLKPDYRPGEVFEL